MTGRIDWPHRLYISNAKLFDKLQTDTLATTNQELRLLKKIFSQFDISPGSTILDVCGGAGRISIPLATRGYSVVGVDFSRFWIRKALKNANQNGVSKQTRFIVGDVRKIAKVLSSYRHSFHAILCFLSPFGLYSRAIDKKFLQDIKTLLHSHGILLVHANNKDQLFKLIKLRPTWSYESQDLSLTITSHAKPSTSQLMQTYVLTKKLNQKIKVLDEFQTRLRVYSFEEILRLLSETGWKVTATFGDLSADVARKDSCVMTLVAKASTTS